MKSEEKEIKLFKGLFSILLVLLLINPITLYLLFGNIFYALLLPLFSLLLLILIWKQPMLSRLKIYYFNILFLISIAYNAELIFTVIFPDRNIPNLYEIKGDYYFNKPYINQQFNDEEYSSVYVTNKQGLRIDETQNPELEISQCDWLFIGDSFTQGAQVEYNDLFTTQTYRYFPDKVILNVGISGFSIIDEYNYYLNEGYKLKPKKVFLQLCIFNDFMNVSPNQIGAMEYMMQYSNLYRYLSFDIQYANPSELPLGRWTEPFSNSEQKNRDYNIFYTLQSEQKSKDIKSLTSYLKKFKDLTKANGAELCVILIPVKEQISYECFAEVVDSFKIDVSKLDMQLPNKLIDSISKAQQFELIDLLSVFSDGEGFPFFERDEHLNILGHKKIADAIKKKYDSESMKYEYMSLRNRGERYPTLFNNGNSILYQSLMSGKFQIFESDTLFHSQTLLYDSKIDNIHPSLSKNGMWLLYTKGNQEQFNTKIVFFDIKQKKEQTITFTDTEYGAIPCFSNNSELVAYSSWKTLGDKLSNPIIILYKIHSKEKIPLTLSDYECWRPVFHPNDSVLYYLSKQHQKWFAIEEVNIYTLEQKTLLKTEYNIWDIAISNDGRQMLFSGFKDDNWDLFLMSMETGVIKQLTNSIGDEWDATFGRDNQSIWFAGTFGTNNGIYKITR